MEELFNLPGFKEVFKDPNSEEFIVNMGPQHPSTHGALRLQLRLDGENIIEVVPHLGYIHRGLEKQAESQNYLQYIHLSDRQDYLTAIQNNLGVCLALEKGMQIGVPERGEYIRVMMAELGRIASHLVFYGCFGGDLGGQTPLIYGFKEREMIHDIFDEQTGSRLTTNFFRPGGSRYDVTDTFIPRVKDFLEKLKPAMEDYERLLSTNLVVLERTQGIGVLSKKDALAFGCSGPVARASGVNYDVRKNDPYGIYDTFDFQVPIRTEGDCYARYQVRIAEIHESMKILEQCISRFPEGPWRSKEKPVRLPAGSYYAASETAKGLYATYVVATSGDKPYRIHTRGPSFANLSALNTMVKGHKVADLVAVMATLDPVIPEIDR
ncbi:MULTISPECIES: NADH-quinone oxidoreductase subunit D [Fibrobacter]|uniref:NADH-quinone oxidoreductase subunit D n=1 Tax=Fibrobacter intestinalis TaxID=28122 RepID=A0A1M6SZ55_9BACT|nr:MULTISPECIES: NADH-quinone oxidoreductase subunit D [Fibrobacter]MDD7299910.1 NADH-quinone oxidoreductase subunit D [Fibrobacter intestinalis]PBC72602.1 NADH-quinone oxidoreductase subunit C/D [Fibrobacter sp. NR9]SHK49950.1 NADH-quinone oxidoreductase subunit D/NADH-quinone oxidoreductase subunit C/D [Fibrobacter intestinalis]SJZ47434.1 NADH dehydrogenase subunit D [Fibrobacter intestinalis]